MQNINIISVDSPTLNTTLVRMNCLALACLDTRIDDKINLAEEYASWVFRGRRDRLWARVHKSDDVTKDEELSGRIDNRDYVKD